jgi:predicted dehydrogenase
MAGEHARAFASLPEVSLVGICGRDPGRAQKLAAEFDVPAFATIPAMFEATKADAVVIAVNEMSMLDVTLQCFRFPWACLLEKPIGIELGETQKIVEARRSAGVDAFVALNRRTYAATRLALEEISVDPAPRLISVLDQQDLASVRSSGQPEAVVRNYMFANSIHLIDYFSIFGRGDVVSISQGAPWTPDSPGFVIATIRFSSGDMGVYQAVWDGPGPWSVTVTNQSTRCEMRPLERLGVQRRGERRLLEVPADSVDSEFKPGLRYQAMQVVRFLSDGQTSLASVDEAARSVRLCAEIYAMSS